MVISCTLVDSNEYPQGLSISVGDNREKSAYYFPFDGKNICVTAEKVDQLTKS